MAANRRTGAWFFSLASLLLVIVVTAGIAPAQGTLAPAEAGSAVSQRGPTLVIGSHHHVANGETVTTYSGSVPLLHESSAHCIPSGNANDLLVCVWLVEPRFGGFAVDESDGSVLKVWLTGEGPTGDAAQRVLHEVNRLWDRQFVSVDVQGASFDIGQLMTWFHRIIAKPGDLITGVDLDEGSNRLIVLVADASDETISSGTAHVTGLGVPEDSFAFEAHSTQIFPPTPDDLPRPARSRRSTSRTRVPISDQLLNHGLNPFVGGGSITSTTNCSAGFPVRVFNQSGDVEEGFVTAGHCGDLGVVFTAPDGDGNQQDLGTSVFNLFLQGVDAQYARKSATADLALGHIARTLSKNTAGGRITDEMRKLDPDNPYFRVSGHRRAAVGDEVHKVGNTTGWTSGTVTKTCYSITFWFGTLSCLDAFTAASAGGDSGAPVFSLETDGTVTLRVTLTGFDASSGIKLTVMTPVDLAFSGLFYDRGLDVQVDPGDFDLDDDGLIEVANLEQLNALRWDLDGDGASSDSRFALAFPQGASHMGCPSDGCIGYELINDLDFDTNGSGEADAGDDYWNNRQGWVPIGSRRNRFDAVFDGNEHVISSLYISVPKSDSIGLFGATGGSAKVRNVNLVGAVVVGDEEVGALIGLNGGRLTGCSATGVVTGGAGVGGLVGRNEGPLSGSSASVDVSAVADRVGGLVGRLHRSSVTASYATGSVSGQYRVGGLVGDSFRSTVSFSYSAGSSDGRGHVGGLIGWQSNQIITDSYWDTESSGLASSAGGNGKLTSELKSPTEYMGIYATWDVDLDDVDEDSFLTTGQDDPWDFGAAGAYPVLRPAAVPDAPIGLTAEFGDSLASLTWQEAKSNRSAIIRMEYQKNGSVWLEIPESASGGTNAVSYAVMGLDNGTEYSFAVRAVSWMGPGQGSNSVNVTPRTIPGRVNVNNVDSSQVSLTISWLQPGDDGGSVVRTYDVRYIADDED